MSEDELGITDIPPHVAAIDARRAANMNRVTNEKLGEWSQGIHYALATLCLITATDDVWNAMQNIRQRLEALQADIVKAMPPPFTPEGIGRAIEGARAEKETRPAYIPHRFQAQGEWDQCTVCLLPEHVWIHSRQAAESKGRS